MIPPVAFLPKHPKKVETVEEDGDKWEFADEEQQGGWYN